MESIKLNANPERLIWARKTSNYKIEEIAHKLKKSVDTIKEWEKTGLIEYDNLSELSNYYKRPTSIFFGKSSLKYPKDDVPDFRTFESETKKEIIPNIAFEIRNAKYRRQKLLNIEEEFNDFYIPSFKLKDLKDKTEEDKIEILKNHLGNSRAILSRTKLDEWIKKVESLGVLVFEFYDISPNDLRGYAIYYDKLPIIGINHREHKNPKKFTLFHELSHLLEKTNGLSNLDGYYMLPNEETVANRIAAEFLVPNNLFNSLINEYRIENFNEKNIGILAKNFNVSKDVVVRKALDLGFINKKEYGRRKNEFNNYLIERNPLPKKKTNINTKSTESHPLSQEEKYQKLASKNLRKNGYFLTKKLFEAYDKELISDLDLTRNLNIPFSALGALRDIIYMG